MISPKGRAAGFNPANRFGRVHLEPLPIEMENDEYDSGLRAVPTRFFPDTSKSILAKNDSPDLPFTYSINPYRGCEHGCIYCYARPSHEYLGFSAGLDFETKIMVKLNAAKLLDETLSKKNWQPQMVAFSGNTDCYQPVEQKLQLTRQCLEIFLQHRNPVGMITKNGLITRDIDLLKEMSNLNIIHVMITITTLDAELLRIMEPRTSSPINRLKAIEELAKAGVTVGVNVAPIIPALTDEEIPAILKAASEHGASSAGYILLRLPGAVEPLFLDWVKRVLPERAPKIINRIRETRNGALSEMAFGKRMRGEGETADAINRLFVLYAKKYNLVKRWEGLSTERFVRVVSNQVELFG